MFIAFQTDTLVSETNEGMMYGLIALSQKYAGLAFYNRYNHYVIAITRPDNIPVVDFTQSAMKDIKEILVNVNIINNFELSDLPQYPAECDPWTLFELLKHWLEKNDIKQLMPSVYKALIEAEQNINQRFREYAKNFNDVLRKDPNYQDGHKRAEQSVKMDYKLAAQQRVYLEQLWLKAWYYFDKTQDTKPSVDQEAAFIEEIKNLPSKIIIDGKLEPNPGAQYKNPLQAANVGNSQQQIPTNTNPFLAPGLQK